MNDNRTGPTYRPLNDTVPLTGAYRESTDGGVLLTRTIWCEQGRHFPPASTTLPGVEIRFVYDE